MDNSPAPDVSQPPSAPVAPDATSSPATTSAAAPIATPVPTAVPAAAPASAPAAPLTQNISEAKDKAIDAIKQSFTGGSAAVTSLIVGASIAFFVAFVLYWIITRAATPFTKITYQVPDTKIPKTGYEVNQVGVEGLPSLKDTATISFWLYVNEFVDVPPNPNNDVSIYRHVWHRGAPKWSPQTVSPLVLIKSSLSKTDKIQKNSLLISFKSSDPDKLLDDVTGLTTQKQKIEYMVATRGISIDYIPVKRWVHVAVTVNRKSKIMKAFLDGENVKTVDASQTTKLSESFTVNRKLPLIEMNGTDDIFVGGRPTSDLGVGFPGLVSNIRYSNWDMSNSEVYREYKRGPVDNLLSRLGLPPYGLQSPIYRIL